MISIFCLFTHKYQYWADIIRYWLQPFTVKHWIIALYTKCSNSWPELYKPFRFAQPRSDRVYVHVQSILSSKVIMCTRLQHLQSNNISITVRGKKWFKIKCYFKEISSIAIISGSIDRRRKFIKYTNCANFRHTTGLPASSRIVCTMLESLRTVLNLLKFI